MKTSRTIREAVKRTAWFLERIARDVSIESELSSLKAWEQQIAVLPERGRRQRERVHQAYKDLFEAQKDLSRRVGDLVLGRHKFVVQNKRLLNKKSKKILGIK